jgi:hypothetical protein
MCIHKGCKKRPHYNSETETKGLYCLTHKLDNMVNVINKKCMFEGCKKQPNYNSENEPKALYCATHKLEGMVDVKSKKCIHEGCKKQPVFNSENETKNTQGECQRGQFQRTIANYGRVICPASRHI